MNTKHGILLMGICLLLVCAFVGTASGTIWYVDDDGGADFTKIQDAINAANESDTIYVYNGSYYEHISISKSLTLIGENRSANIIGLGSGKCVYITANNVLIEGFTIRNGDYGVYIFKDNACNNTIINNAITLNHASGIWIERSNNNSIINNSIVENDGNGIELFLNSKNSTVYNNNISSNSYRGIRLYYSGCNVISNNSINSNGYGGITLESWCSHGCDYNIISDNTISNNIYGDGIVLDISCYNEIYNNNISLNHDDNLVFKDGSNYNIITRNTVINGNVVFEDTYFNAIHHNNFILSQHTVSDAGSTNSWDNGSTRGGNYWSDHNCTGNPSNGSQPYIIDTDSIDHYPFQDQNGWFFQVGAHFRYSPENPIVNQLITFDASSSTGNITNYEWEFGDGSNATGIIVTHSYSANGTYTVNLAVTDDEGATDTTSNAITVISGPKIIYVPDNYSTIQDAINAANAGDTIFVYNGTYIEQLTIDKDNLAILGEDRNTTIIDGHGYEGDVVTIGNCVINCTINGFTIENCGVSDAGIATGCSKYINISNNIIKNNYRGINLPGYWCACKGYELRAGHNIITQNIISDNNGAGISADSPENVISHNEIFSNNGDGIRIYSDNNTISDNNVSYNRYSNIDLSGSKNNVIANNTIKYDGSCGIEVGGSCYYNMFINNTISSTYEGGEEVYYSHGIYIRSSNHNYVIANTFNKNYHAIRLNQANYNLIRNNNILNNYRGIDIDSSNNNLLYHNNLINNIEQASDDGSNSWDNGSIEGGNYWSDHNCTGNPSNGSEPYSIEDEWPAPTPAPTAEPTTPPIPPPTLPPTPAPTAAPTAAPAVAPTSESEQYYSEGGGVDHYPFEDPNGWIHVENFSFDTGSPVHPYPNIFGTHNGTITSSQTITVSKLYTYPCAGTGGHTEYARIWNSTLDVNATWNGYVSDWHNITFDEPFTLFAEKTYYYEVRTGSYPQIIHTDEWEAKGGMGIINCTSFVDANGKIYNDWIPAIRLE